MKNKKGFTLTEILLAVMVVGIIGVALAALTTAASRESGVGRSKVLLRNNLSIALRQMRRDIQESSKVLYVSGPITAASASKTSIPLLRLGKDMTQDDARIIESVIPRIITYCFVRGKKTETSSGAKVLPEGATDGGEIVRIESSSFDTKELSCTAQKGDKKSTLLSNVKYIPSTQPYPVPLFAVSGWAGAYNTQAATEEELKQMHKNLGSVLNVNLILELPSHPVVNDVTEETFVLPNGFGVRNN